MMPFDLVAEVTCFFFVVLALANPFERVTPSPGTGPNPLLQDHILMAFHPPILYTGYVGFSVPFAFAVAALATGGPAWIPGSLLLLSGLTYLAAIEVLRRRT